MAKDSPIEWTQTTWNVITGCSVVSPGCTNCYAMRLAGTRLRMQDSYRDLTLQSKAGPVWNGQLRFNEQLLELPLRLKKPHVIFVNSMGDLFHEDVPDEWIDRVFAVMNMAQQHTFQVLTKRAERMKNYIICLNENKFTRAGRVGSLFMSPLHTEEIGHKGARVIKPHPNVWLGVSCEDQARAVERIPHLLATPAAVRFISAEPLLGPIDLTKLTESENDESGGTETGWHINALEGNAYDDVNGDLTGEYREAYGNAKLDWVIVGGESGKGARPMHPDWARNLLVQCDEAGTAFFFKQWGNWSPYQIQPGGDLGGEMRKGIVKHVCANRENDGHFKRGDVYMKNMGKSKAGRLLNGCEYNAMPVKVKDINKNPVGGLPSYHLET